MKSKTNGSRLDETTALLQHAMATLLQNQTLFVSRVEELKDQMDRKFTEVDRRLEHIESLLAKMFAELPAKVFGFGQAAARKQSGQPE